MPIPYVATYVRKTGRYSTGLRERNSAAVRPKPKKKLTDTATMQMPERSGRISSSLSCIRIRYDCPTRLKLRLMRPMGSLPEELKGFYFELQTEERSRRVAR